MPPRRRAGVVVSCVRARGAARRHPVAFNWRPGSSRTGRRVWNTSGCSTRWAVPIQVATWGLMRAARSQNTGTGGSRKGQSRAPLQLEGGGQRAAGAGRPRCARHLGRARLRSAGWSKSGRSCMVAATRTAAGCPGGRCPGVQRDGRAQRPSPKVPGPAHASASGHLLQVAAARKEPSCPQAYAEVWAIRRASSPHARYRQREQPTWRHGQVRVGLWPLSVTADLGRD